ncbi:MAG TPA: RidA family protein [Bryobacteraceae bacterium]|nr:RidA family protein [Bryobacteraceae bacterium]
MKRIALICLLSIAVAGAVEKRVIIPAGARPPVGPYSPGILAGDYLYVSGQGAAKQDGTFPISPEDQVRQCFANVRQIVEAANLKMANVVYAQVYLKDMSAYDAMHQVWGETFPERSPARAVLGVARMPTETPVEITVVAYRNPSRVQPVGPAPDRASPPAGVLVGDRLYLSGSSTNRAPDASEPADEVQGALDRMGAALKAAGMDFRHVVFVNPYLTDKMPMDVMNRIYAKHFEFGNTPARATIRVSTLPGGASIEFTGVAVRDLAKRRAVRPKNMPPSATASPCVFADDTYYCSAKSGFIPGPNTGIYASTVETQLRQTMRNLLDGLEEAELSFADVVATNVYQDDLNEFSRMNKVYAEYFSQTPPTRTTVQQIVPAERKPDARDRWPTLEQISVIAVK